MQQDFSAGEHVRGGIMSADVYMQLTGSQQQDTFFIWHRWLVFQHSFWNFLSIFVRLLNAAR
jgi:hypothetical protein